MTFNIALSLLDNGEFSVIESTEYSDLTFNQSNIGHYEFIEFLSYTMYDGTKSIVSNSPVYTSVTTPAATFAGNFNYKYTIVKDGSYLYTKVAIIKYEYATLPLVENDIYWKDGKIYLYNGTTSVELTLLNLLDNFIHIDSSFQSSFFAIVILDKCLVTYQKKLLPMFIDCQKDFRSDKQKRDFLLDASYILHYLVHINNIPEAQRFVERLQTCVSLCGEDSINSLNSCNCG